MLFSRVCFFLLSITIVSTVNAEVLEVYFVTGQSNGGNLTELNSYDPQGYTGLNQADANRSEQGFTLDFARIFDRTSNNPNTGLDEIFHQFSESQLDPAQFATDRLAVDLNTAGNSRMAIFSYCRNGRPLYNGPNDNGESWFPGNDPANGDVFDDELYGYFSDYSSARIAELEAQGNTVIVKGIFWFQGEGDVGIGDVATDAYEQNYQRLVDRFRVDFGPQVVVVGTEIRLTGNAATQARQQQVNDGLAAVAAADPLVKVVTTQDLTPLDPGNVHFTAGAYHVLAGRWAAACTGSLPLTSNLVYQDDFDGDGLGVNAGIGGGGFNTSFNNAGSWTDDGNLSAGVAGLGSQIWTFTSDNSFDCSGGFTLEVVFDQLFDDNNGSNASAPFNSNHFAFGMTGETTANSFLAPNGQTPADDGIGVSWTTRSGNVDIGVLEQDDSAGTTTTLDPINSSTVGVGQTFMLSVDETGAYTWTFGAESGSGTTALDLTVPFFFTARTQGSSGNVIQSVTLESAGDGTGNPPPTSNIIPNSFTLFRGVSVTGELGDFVDSDDIQAMFEPGFVLNSLEAPVWLIFDGNGVAPTAIQVESTAGTPGLEYTVEAFNWVTNSYDIVGIQTETFNSDQIQQYPIVDDHVSDDCDLRTRIGWRQVGFTINFPWVVSVDQVVWPR